MTVVTNTLVDVTGRPLQDVTVTSTAIVPGNPFLLNGLGEVVQRYAADTDHDGVWTADLLPNDQYEQEGTYYLVDESRAPGGLQWSIHVPDTPPDPGYPTYPAWTLRDLLVYVPPADNPGSPVVGGGGSFVYVQSSAADVWTIPHRLGRLPNITCLSGQDPGTEADGLEYATRADPNVDTTVLHWSVAIAGRAVCT